ncbi:protein of unknown function [Cupriavidus taiwanensis]|uniref:Uncharacterized protein n=1 Tax=Cupriavidus taiwanensis TaxID=164546 RepID=A0A375DEG9_9BURK|nr:protein of unknown function [Cupriavidus taiwanensis]SOZ03381.1 hypothetical protein CBM2597_A130030 [Cupriavidus taiwanensis]SOZ08891.1 hypothetical protein CBM2595_A90029 [Cupriavidus taiwanensis]SPC07170.1 hypothetical protein CBM2594_A100030 [Cupriavidus taiwanensis]SPC11274.1 hypothetical protein CT19431_30128 [Cupriavidus taiwanensis]
MFYLGRARPRTVPGPQKVTIAFFVAKARNLAEPARCDAFVSSRSPCPRQRAIRARAGFADPVASRNPLIPKTTP